MALKTLPDIRCSLFVGAEAYIYNFSYSFAPQDGAKISLFYVSPTGVYFTRSLINSTQPVTVTVGANTLRMYVFSFEETRSSTQRTLRVELIDETFLLGNHHIVLKGQGCGQNVYEIGSPVDNRSAGERLSTSPDKTARRIQALTQFDDLEYTFGNFIDIVQRVFIVSVRASYDSTVTKGFVGSFREVLDAWCSYFNLGYYFENSKLTIISPSQISLNFPQVPADAIESHYRESAEGTFTKTACAYFRQDGGQFTVPTANANSDSDASTISYATLYPAGYENGLEQQKVDLNQVAAAMYGQKYWFLYNYAMGTAQTECGWTRISIVDIPPSTTISKTALTMIGGPGGGIATLDSDTFEQKFQFYKTYGESIAGRYYLSQQRGNIFADKGYEWYDQTTTVNFKLKDLKNPLSIEAYQEGVTTIDGVIADTAINKYFTGIRATGNRLIYRDSRRVDLITPFTLDQATQNVVNKFYSALIDGAFGSATMDYGEISANAQYVVFTDQQVFFEEERSNPTSLPAITADQIALFKPQQPALQLKGVDKTALEIDPDSEFGLSSSIGPTIISDTSTVKAKNGSSTVVYYGKYEKCASQSSGVDASKAFSHVFIPRQISADIPISFSVSKSSKKVYTLQRDLTYVNRYINSDVLRTLSTAQLEPLKTLTFTLNYLPDDIFGAGYLSSGLTSFSVEITDHGLTATYAFSNSILRVPMGEAFIEKLESNMKNSWIRTYRPDQSIGS